MPHRKSKVTSNSRILGSRALINLHQVICKIRTTKFFLLRRKDVRKLVSRLPTAAQLRNCPNVVQVLLCSLLFVRPVPEKKRDSDADRDEDQRKQRELRNTQGSRLPDFDYV